MKRILSVMQQNHSRDMSSYPQGDDYEKSEGARLVVIIPAFNEAATIERVIKSVPTDIPGVRDTEIVVIDDGSEDNTAQLARDAGAHVVSHYENRGVGASYASGVHEALQRGADIVVNIDADGQFNSADIPKLIKPLLAGEAGLVTASRFKDPQLIPDMPLARLMGNRLVSLIISLIVGRRFYDVSCGFRACSRETALHLNMTGSFTYTQEMFLDLSFKGIHVIEVPVVVRGSREHGKSAISSNLFSYATRALRIILRAYRDYWPWRFFASLAAICFAVSIILGSWLLYWRLTHASFSPHIWSGFVGGFFFMIGMIFILMGMVADMLRMIRLNAERSLYFDKRLHYGASKQEHK